MWNKNDCYRWILVRGIAIAQRFTKEEMGMKLFLASIATGLMIVGIAAPASADPVLEFSSGTTGIFQGANASWGWSFTTNQAITVNALDAFDVSGTDVGNVRLYDAGGNVLATATVVDGDPQEGSPTLFHSHAISPISLAINTTYFIVEDITDSVTSAEFHVVGLTTDAEITYDQGVSALDFGQDPTTDFFGGVIDPAFFGPNFDATITAAAVPEPSSMALLGGGLLVFSYFRRRKTG